MKSLTPSYIRPNAAQMSRRTFLRGVGVTMALPWLESVPVWGRSIAKDGCRRPFPKRFAALFMGCGINPTTGGPRARARTMELGKSLEPLAPLKTKMNVITGLFNKHATGVGIHPGQTGNILSGASLQKGAELHGGISMDQVLANHFGQETVAAEPGAGLRAADHRLPRDELLDGLQLAHLLAERDLAGADGGLPVAGLRQPVRQPRQPAEPEHPRPRPGQAGEPEPAGQRERQGEARRVPDQRPRGREARRADAGRTRTGPTSGRRTQGRPALTMQRPDNGLPEDIREHMRLMCDIIALGFQTDKTRVATLLLCRDISGLFYPFLDVRTAHHSASHDDRSDAYERITRYYVQPARLPRHEARRDAGRRGHGARQLVPAVHLEHVVGQQARLDARSRCSWPAAWAGRSKTGRVLDYTDKGDENRKLCSLYLSLMDRMGVKLDAFGDATTRLAGL